MQMHHWIRSGLFTAHPTHSHELVLAPKSAWGNTNKTKTDVVVPVIGIVPVAVSRATIPGIVVPRTTAFLPDPLLDYFIWSPH
jgi:hypothetical protein